MPEAWSAALPVSKLLASTGPSAHCPILQAAGAESQLVLQEALSGIPGQPHAL